MKTYTFILLSIFASKTWSQDIHFSQFWEPMSFASPAQIGNFDGNLKLSAQYRNQWSQFNTPITTMFGDVTYKIPKEDQYFAFSISFLRDQLSYLSYHQIRMSSSLAYQKKIAKKLWVGIGFQAGTRLTSIDYNRLTFDKQWEPNSGQFIYSKPNFEHFTANSVYTPFFSLGGAVNYQRKKWLHTIDIGTMIITKNGDSDFVHYQPLKVTTNLHSYFSLNDNITLMPKFGWIASANANSLLISSLIKCKLDDHKDIYGGLQYRWGSDRNGDAIVPTAGFRIKRMRVGISYDWVLSGLSQENLKSAFEISTSITFKQPKQKYFSIDCLRL